MTPGAGWRFREHRGSAISFHARALPDLTGGVGEVWIQRSTRPAIVLGSAQTDDLIDTEAAQAAGWEVGRRRSGGGTVVVAPGTHVWVDLLIGPDHPRWDDDVHRAFDWVGASWAQVIATTTGVRPPVHAGALVDRAAGRLLCFAGLGAGEIAIDDHKVLGLSQRRTRAGARFQTMLELADHSASLRPYARGALAELLDERANTHERGIGLPPDRPDLAPLRHLDHVIDALRRVLTFDPVSPT